MTRRQSSDWAIIIHNAVGDTHTKMIIIGADAAKRDAVYSMSIHSYWLFISRRRFTCIKLN